MLLLIDNYDSFTINLEQVSSWRPEKIVISPGPCTPNEAGISVSLVQRFAGEIPILGVCLGHQAIGQAFGGRIVRAGRVMHGKLSSIAHRGEGVFEGLASPFTATRYYY